MLLALNLNNIIQSFNPLTEVNRHFFSISFGTKSIRNSITYQTPK